jgi:hypothetical protein
MIRRVKCYAVALAIALTPGALLADDLSDSNEFLCSVSLATVCYADGDCEIGMPWTWNIPEFIEVDLAQKKLATTEASGERRFTPIKNYERDDHRIILQGAERGRAFSVTIREVTGRASFAVAADEFSISAFGACTPLASTR